MPLCVINNQAAHAMIPTDPNSMAGMICDFFPHYSLFIKTMYKKTNLKTPQFLRIPHGFPNNAPVEEPSQPSIKWLRAICSVKLPPPSSCPSEGTGLAALGEIDQIL